LTFYTRAECERLARERRIGATIVRAAIRSGELPARVVGTHRYLVRDDDLEAWLDAPGRAVEPVASPAAQFDYVPSFMLLGRKGTR
jgi:hypothetical protein